MALIALLIMHSKYAGSLVWTRGVFSLVDWSTAGWQVGPVEKPDMFGIII